MTVEQNVITCDGQLAISVELVVPEIGARIVTPEQSVKATICPQIGGGKLVGMKRVRRRWVLAVSYTHLDVYKRQVLKRSHPH